MQLTDNLTDYPAQDNVKLDWLKTAILLGLALYFAYNIVSGNLTNYINVRFAWLSYVAVVLFALLGGVNAYRLLRGADPQTADQTLYRLNSVHNRISWSVVAITAIPLLLGTLIPSRPLGAAAINGDSFSTTSALASTDNATTFTIAPLDRNILDWIRVFNASDDLAAFNGQEAEVIGFVYKDDTFTEDQFLAARFTISCCVADSTAIGLPVQWDESIPQDTWVRVYGTFALQDFRGEQRPVLQPTSVDVIDQPEHPYLYP